MAGRGTIAFPQLSMQTKEKRGTRDLGRPIRWPQGELEIRKLAKSQLSTDIKIAVTNLFTAADLLRPHQASRAALGIVLQNPVVRPWSRSIVWAAVMEILPIWTSGWNGDCDTILQRYIGLQRHIQESGLDIDIDKMPLINVSCCVYL
jgi:hypothetical protein